jgi:type I restriction enzyme R subunit
MRVTKMTESDIELMAIEQLEELGYTYIYGPEIESKASHPLRSYKQVILESKVLEALQRLNPQLGEDKCLEALKQITNIQSPDLLSNNQSFHRLLTEGINIEITKEGNTQGELAWLIDFNQPNNNEFLVVNQVTIREDRWERRPDLILYVNGLPLVVIELKNAADENATIEGAYKQIQTYKSQIQSLFTYNAFNIISDGLEAKAGTISADLSRYMAWKTTNGQTKAKKTQAQLEVLIQGLLNPVTLLDMIRHFIVFESSKQEDANGLITIKTIKKMAAYHQYYAVNAAVLSTIRASAITSDSKSAEVAMQHRGEVSSNLYSSKL